MGGILSSFSRLKALFALLACGVAALTPAQAGILTVTNAGDSGPGTLRAQVAAAAPGDTIVFGGMLSGDTIALTNGQIEITNSSLTVDGASSPGRITISGSNASRIFLVDAGSGLILKSLGLANGYESSDFGGAIKNDGSLVASFCTFSGNVVAGAAGTPTGSTNEYGAGYPLGGGSGGGGGGFGGAIFSDGPTLTLAGCLFTNNLARGGSGGNGGYYNYNTNFAGGAGGGVYGGAGANGAGINGNPGGFGGGGGGGGSTYNSQPGIGGTGGFGGGGGGTGGSISPFLYLGGPGGPFGGPGGAYEIQTITGSGGGGAGLGGAVFTQSGTIYISNCTFGANTAVQGTAGMSPDDSGEGLSGTGYGGGLFNMSPALALTNNVFTNNAATTGVPDIFTTPQLSMVVTNGNLQFTWSTNEPGFSLEYSAVFSPSNWQPVSGTNSISGSIYVQTVAPTPGFFRLYVPVTNGYFF